jgi:hypothetical protein
MHPCWTRSSYLCIDERVRKDLPKDKIFSSAPAPPRDCISSSASSVPLTGKRRRGERSGARMSSVARSTGITRKGPVRLEAS